MYKIKPVLPLLVILLATAMTGCSSLPHRVDLMYQPLATAKGGGGNLYLASAKAPEIGFQDKVLWVVGQIRDKDGTVIDDIVSPVSSRTQVTDALNQELAKAGYQVLLGEANPEGVAFPYLRVSEVKITLSEVPSWLKVTSSAKVSLKLEFWLSGKLLKNESYESEFKESYPRTQTREIQVVLQKALEEITDKAVADIVQTVGRRTGG